MLAGAPEPIAGGAEAGDEPAFEQLADHLVEAAHVAQLELLLLARLLLGVVTIAALAVVAVQTFLGSWNNFLGPYIYINTKENMTIALGLQWFKSEQGSMYGEMMATTLAMTLPVIVLFFFCQRYMVQGIAMTGLKT